MLNMKKEREINHKEMEANNLEIRVSFDCKFRLLLVRATVKAHFHCQK